MIKTSLKVNAQCVYEFHCNSSIKMQEVIDSATPDTLQHNNSNAIIFAYAKFPHARRNTRRRRRKLVSEYGMISISVLIKDEIIQTDNDCIALLENSIADATCKKMNGHVIVYLKQNCINLNIDLACKETLSHANNHMKNVLNKMRMCIAKLPI